MGDLDPGGSSSDPTPDLIARVRADFERIIEARQRLGRAEVEVSANAGLLGTLPSERIRGYRVTRLIGRGGQGVVYEATQLSTGRTVAIKTLKAGFLADAAQRSRFRREAQSLAALDHPYIVALFDGGEVAGHPFLVMEHLRAKPLREYVESHQPTVRETCVLFAKICEAVAAAHQKLWIHRDLKPANILIDEKGDPHVLDFGLAKLLENGTEADITEGGELLGTRRYAAPEQFDGSPHKVDVRTDIWSLGVIFYETLVRQWPWGDRPGSEIEHCIRSEDPVRPRRLRRQMDDDVETIIVKCLSKDTNRRYATAEALASDVRRYIAGDAIDAKRDSRAYVLRKLLRRHRVAVSIAAAFGALLTTASILSTVLYIRAEGERQKAEDAEQFMANILAGVDPYVANGRDTALLNDILTEASARLCRGELVRAPESQIQVRLVIGNTYRSIAQYDEASEMLTRALELARSTYGKDHLVVAQCLRALGLLALHRGDWTEGLELADQTLAMRRRMLPNVDAAIAESFSDRGQCLLVLDRVFEAQSDFEAALEVWEQLGEPDDSHIADTLNRLGLSLKASGRFEDAQVRFEEALAIYRGTVDGEHPIIARTLGNIGNCQRALGRYDAAVSMLEASLVMRRKLLPDDHPELAAGINDLGYCLRYADRHAESLTLFEESYDLTRRLFQGDHPNVATSLENLGAALLSLNRPSEALPNFEASLEMRRRLFPGDHHHVADGQHHVARCLRLMGRTKDALPLAEGALRMGQRIYPGDHSNVASYGVNYADCLLAVGRREEALTEYETALAMRRRIYCGDHPDIASSLNQIALCLNALRRTQDALSMLVEAQEMYERLQTGDTADYAKTINNVGACLLELQRGNEAVVWLERAMAMRRRCLQGNHIDICVTEWMLGRALLLQGNGFVEAEMHLTRANECVTTNPSAPPGAPSQTAQALVQLYKAWHAAEPGKGYDLKAAEWRAKLDAAAPQPDGPAPSASDGSPESKPTAEP